MLSPSVDLWFRIDVQALPISSMCDMHIITLFSEIYTKVYVALEGIKTLIQ